MVCEEEVSGGGNDIERVDWEDWRYWMRESAQQWVWGRAQE